MSPNRRPPLRAGDELGPVPDAPALLLRPSGRGAARTLLVADLHLGVGAGETANAPPPAAGASALADGLIELARAQRARRVVIAGDAKHPVVGVPPRLARAVFDFFGALLAADLSVDLVRGNHDAGIDRAVPREVAIHPATGLVLGGVGIFHGHRWPGPALVPCGTLVVGHLHPGFRLAPTPDRPSGKERGWLRVELPAPVPGPRRTAPPFRARQLIVLPPFHPLAGVESLNVEKPRRGRSFLVARFLARGSARGYLLDGTDVGPIVLTGPDPPTGGGRRSAPGR